MPYKLQVTGPWYRATIADPELGPITVDTDRDARTPQLIMDYPTLGMQDATSQPAANVIPDINLVEIIAIVEEEIADAIQADPTYLVTTCEQIP